MYIKPWLDVSVPDSFTNPSLLGWTCRVLVLPLGLITDFVHPAPTLGVWESKFTADPPVSTKLSKNTKVLPRIKELQDQAKKRNDIDIDWCLSKLKDIVEDDSNDRVAAVDKIIKHLGGYEKNNDQKSTKINLSRFTDEEISQKLKEIANDPNKY